jgi:hypothetical protein
MDGRRVSVHVRLRPRIAEDQNAEPVARPGNNGVSVVLGERGTFGPFDGTFDAAATQESVYAAVAHRAVAGVVAGECNGTVMCYVRRQCSILSSHSLSPLRAL